jgi:phytoene dehydrogenase-like protein
VATALDRGAPSLLAAAATVLPAPGAPRTPVFGTLRGGLGRLVDALVAAGGATVRRGLPVCALARREHGWRLELGSPPEYLDVDAVLLAVPAPALRRLLAGPLPAASAAAARVEVASSVVVGLALPAAPPRRRSGCPPRPGSSSGRGSHAQRRRSPSPAASGHTCATPACCWYAARSAGTARAARRRRLHCIATTRSWWRRCVPTSPR